MAPHASGTRAGNGAFQSTMTSYRHIKLGNHKNVQKLKFAPNKLGACNTETTLCHLHTLKYSTTSFPRNCCYKFNEILHCYLQSSFFCHIFVHIWDSRTELPLLVTAYRQLAHCLLEVLLLNAIRRYFSLQGCHHFTAVWLFFLSSSSSLPTTCSLLPDLCMSPQLRFVQLKIECPSRNWTRCNYVFPFTVSCTVTPTVALSIAGIGHCCLDKRGQIH